MYFADIYQFLKVVCFLFALEQGLVVFSINSTENKAALVQTHATLQYASKFVVAWSTVLALSVQRDKYSAYIYLNPALYIKLQSCTNLLANRPGWQKE